MGESDPYDESVILGPPAKVSPRARQKCHISGPPAAPGPESALKPQEIQRHQILRNTGLVRSAM